MNPPSDGTRGVLCEVRRGKTQSQTRAGVKGSARGCSAGPYVGRDYVRV